MTLLPLLLLAGVAHALPVLCPPEVPRSYKDTGCGGMEFACPSRRPAPFADMDAEDWGHVRLRAEWAKEGRPGTGCCATRQLRVFCAHISAGAVGQHSHAATRGEIMSVLHSGPEEAFEWLQRLRKQGEDVARRRLRQINDYDLAALAFMVSQQGDGFFDGSHEVGGEAFIFVLTAKLGDREAALAGNPTPRDAGKIDAIVGKLGGFGYIFQLFPTLSRFITGKGGAGSASFDIPDKANRIFHRLLQAKEHDRYYWPTFLPEERKFTPGDWRGYNAYADSVTRSTVREGTAEPLFNGGYVPVKGRPVVNQEKMIEPNGDLLAREIKPGEPLKMEDPTSCFPRAVEAIKQCQPRDPVYLSVFVFQNDEWARTFAEVLIDARKRNCDVIVIYDEAGSGLSDHKVDADGKVEQLPTDPAIYDHMRANGVPVIEWPTTSWKSDKISSHLNHRKILIVGGGPNRKRPAEAYGFLNVGTEYAAIWSDFSWRITGPAIVDIMRLWQEQMNRVFYRLKPGDFERFAGKNPHTPFHVLVDIKEWTDRVMEDWAREKPVGLPVYKTIRTVGHIGLQDIDIKTINIAAIKTSVNRIKVQCPYITDKDFLQAMVDAGHRFKRAGKKGQVVLSFPLNNDMGITKLALRTWYQRLLDAGVELRGTTQPMTHGKAKLFDDLVEGGSSNLDTRSLWNNDEQITVVEDHELANLVDKRVFHDPTDILIDQKWIDMLEDDTINWLKAEGAAKIWMQL